MSAQLPGDQTVVWLDLDERELVRLAQISAFKLGPGDTIALFGDLGAGKTTFARAFIRAALANSEAEVPSPTFALRQDYEGPRYRIAHVDLYRLTHAEEAQEIGLDEGRSYRVTLMEWPERTPDSLPADRFELHIKNAENADTRRIAFVGLGRARQRAQRILDLKQFLLRAQLPADFALTFLQGDASSRSYARLTGRETSLVLMDAPHQPDGAPVRDGKPYSRIAHLAEDVRPFCAIGDELARNGLSAAKIHQRDIENGFLLVEDLGDRAFGVMLGKSEPQAPMWLAAVDALVAMRMLPVGKPLPVGDGTTYQLPRFDRAALEIETELLLDWYWPAVKGSAVPDAIRFEFRGLWASEIDKMLAEPPGWFLRDYHSPNLFWLPERDGARRVGLIDYQDALAEPWAYDLVSLLQDARVDVSAELERDGYERYCAAIAKSDVAFDRIHFSETYARFGLQRNTRLAGLWVRLLQRDGKPGYLKHMPRTWDYIGRSLAHPAMTSLRVFYDRHFPEHVRKTQIAP